MVVDSGFHDLEFDQGDRSVPLAFHLVQQQLYDDLIAAVRSRSPVEAITYFEALFFSADSQTLDPGLSPFVSKVLLADAQAEFCHTLKRACYIFINNWELARQGHLIEPLLSLFQQPSLKEYSSSPSLERLRQWLINFANSQDFAELKLFATQRLGLTQAGSWSNRYVAYQLVSQSVDKNNSIEQREAAHTLSRRLKSKFKHDLAMYTAFARPSARLNHKYPNPTVLGDEVLRLVKTILVRQGPLSHRHVARLFQRQTHEATYASYKESLLDYLCFATSQPDFLSAVKKHLGEKLPLLYSKYDSRRVNSSLTLRTCNRLIDYLTTEDQSTPSQLFGLLLSQGNPLNVAVLLLKIVLISPSSRLYLEARLANLVSYYQQFMEVECRSLIQFLEICAVTFTIYSQSVEYNLVKVTADHGGQNLAGIDAVGLEEFRIFSRSLTASRKQLRRHPAPKD